MSKFFAFEWDDRELRIVGGSPRGDGLTVDSMRIIPWQAGPGEGDASDANSADANPANKDEMPAGVATALKNAGLGKSDAIAVINRSRVELKQLSLPPVPDDELPDLVRFQAMREFAKLSEDWPLDYLPLAKPAAADDHEDKLSVLAAAIPPEMLSTVSQGTGEAGLTLTHMVLRPCGSASLFLRRAESAQHRLVVLIDVSEHEADITVLHGRDPVLLRTARLAQDVLQEGASAGSLLGEIRRTLPAAHNIVRGERVSAIFLSGATAGHQRLAESIQGTLEIPCSTFDPLDAVEVGRKAQADTSNPGIFAPLVGALLDEAQGVKHSFDFEHPRRRPVPPNQRRRMVLVGAVAAVLVLGLYAIYWSILSGYESEAEKFNKKIAALEDEIKDIKTIRKRHELLSKFEKSNIDWLRELEALSGRLPPADVKVTSLIFGTNETTGGNIKITGLASDRVVRNTAPPGDNTAAQQLYEQLNDGRHLTDPGQIKKSADPRLPYDFQLDVRVSREPVFGQTSTTAPAPPEGSTKGKP